MQVLCKKTTGNAETHCCVCGQGFVMFWDRQSRAERIATVHEIQRILRNHHRTADGPAVHPNDSFMVPEWSCASARSSVSGEATTEPVMASAWTSKS